MIARITIFGANADYTGNPIVTAKSNLTGLTGYKAVTMDVNFVDPEPVNEGRVDTYLNNYEFAVNKFRFEYNIQTVPQKFDSGVFIDEFEFVQLLGKKYHWVDFNNYPYTLYSSPGTNAMRVNIKDFKFISTPASKRWDIKLGDLEDGMGR